VEDLGGPVEDPRAEAWCTHQVGTARRTWEDLWRTCGGPGWVPGMWGEPGGDFLYLTGARPQSLTPADLPCVAARAAEPSPKPS
jgi:hypothetical protein